jgi:hypothetical protein
VDAWLLRHRVRVFVHRIRFPGKPMFDAKAAGDLIGRRIIVGITQEDYLQRPIGEEHYHGRIIRANPQEGIVIQTPAGDEKALPPDLRSVSPAKPGAYKLRSTGETIADAELTTTWIRPSSS